MKANELVIGKFYHYSGQDFTRANYKYAGSKDSFYGTVYQFDKDSPGWQVGGTYAMSRQDLEDMTPLPALKSYTVQFEKNFISGILSGLVVPCTLYYSEYKTGAEEYVRWLTTTYDQVHTDCLTNDEWYATNAEVVESEVVL